MTTTWTKADECREAYRAERKRLDELMASQHQERMKPGRARWIGWPERCLAAAHDGKSSLTGKVECGPPPRGGYIFEGFVAAASDDGFEVRADHASGDGCVTVTVRWGCPRDGG